MANISYASVRGFAIKVDKVNELIRAGYAERTRVGTQTFIKFEAAKVKAYRQGRIYIAESDYGTDFTVKL